MSFSADMETGQEGFLAAVTKRLAYDPEFSKEISKLPHVQLVACSSRGVQEMCNVMETLGRSATGLATGAEVWRWWLSTVASIHDIDRRKR